MRREAYRGNPCKKISRPTKAPLSSISNHNTPLSPRLNSPKHNPYHHQTLFAMPLDTSTYSLALLRLDGRRWNELRRLTAQISTLPSADGSSYLEMGNTKAAVEVVIGVAGFAGVDRKKTRGGRGDKRISELQTTIQQTFTPHLFTHLYPHSTITIALTILSSDGSLLAALINASTLALISAGIPQPSYITACTAGSTSSYSSNDESADPLLDLNLGEEQELPFLTVATKDEDEVVVLVMESRCQVGRVEGMLAVGVDGCKQVRQVLDGVVRETGLKTLENAKI
ncbi:ribosomal protein S5 domain 2-type protein [Halenospora varia]|nr:ribosomal protein S5 domain 2-type protein [Halenospora varia]